MSLTINIQGDERVVNGLNDAVKKMRNLQPQLEETGNLLISEYAANFPEEGARLGKQWAALARSTVIQKARLGYGNKGILVRTGAMMNAFAKEVQKFSVRVFNPTSYFPYHQLGGGTLPQRQMISMPEKLKQGVVAVFTKLLHEIAKGI